MVKYREILRLHAMGVSIRNIAFSCRCSTATVRAVAGRAKAAGIEWPLPEEMGDRAIREVIYPPKSKADPDKAPIDHDHVDAEMSRPGVTMMLLWSEHCESAVSQGRSPYMYSAFCERHRKWVMSHKTAMRIAHKPAEQMQVDYVGDTMEVVDMDTGEVLKVYVFAACLPFSGKLYAKGSYDMREESWVDAHVSAFSFFGGTTPILVPDNLKQGVAKHTVDELVINEQYRRMAEYYGCAVVPGRPRRPRDKAAVEMGVRVIEQQAIAPLRNRVFTSLDALNAALLDNVARINARPFQKREGSRDEIFLRQEKALLVPLPGKPYEMIARKAATVNFNYHVAFDGGWYSVPFSYVRREVEVCATKSAVWVVCDGERIAMHKRLHEPRPHARRPPRLRRVERGSLPQMGKGNRPRLRRRHRGDPLVEGGRAAVLQILQGGDGAGRQARRARARAGLRQGALLFSQAELQDHQVDHRQKRRAVREGPGCRRVSARQRLLRNPR